VKQARIKKNRAKDKTINLLLFEF